MPTQDKFRVELRAQMKRAQKQGRPHVEINAGELHRTLGGYPGGSHAIPSCCAVMRNECKGGKVKIIHEPPSGDGPSLTIRYYLPRQTQPTDLEEA